MRFIKIDVNRHGFTLVNIDNIRWVYINERFASIAFGDDCHLDTSETIESLERKIRNASKAPKIGGEK